MRSNHRMWMAVLLSAALIVVAACGRSDRAEPGDTPDATRAAEPIDAGAEAEQAPQRLAEPPPAAEPATPRRDVAPARPVDAPASPAPAPPPTPRAPAPEAPATVAPAAAPAAPPAPRVVAVPEGTTLPLVLTSSVATDTSEVEDPVTARVAHAVTIDGATAIPEGAVVRGTVSETTRSGRVSGRAELAIRFHTLVIDERTYDIATAPVARRAEATTKKDAQKVAVPAAAGGVIGAIAGGRKGAAIGAAAGAAAGTGAVLVTRGDEIRLPSGTSLSATLVRSIDIEIP